MSSYKTCITNDLWEQVKPQLDKYATFCWNDESMTDYHMFIINEKKGSLKFYNGPSFSNSYTNPQFSSAAGQLTGVTFSTQQISFTVAVYAVTEAEYRHIIYKFHPYTIANLSFDFQPKWRYIVKLSKIGDSTRYHVGKNSTGEDLYYTELSLTFELQGDAVAQSVSEVDYELQEGAYDGTSQTAQVYFRKTINQVVTYGSSDLDTPFILTFRLTPQQPVDGGANTITCKLVNKQHELTLFNLQLANLTYNTSYIFEYNSQTGDLCIVNGDERKVLTLLTTYTTGKRIVGALTSVRGMLPGTFGGGDWSNLYLSLTTQYCKLDLRSTMGCGINCYARTILI